MTPSTNPTQYVLVRILIILRHFLFPPNYVWHWPCMALASMFDIRFDTGLVFTSVHTYFYSYFFFIMNHTKIVVKIVLGDLLHEGIM